MTAPLESIVLMTLYQSLLNIMLFSCLTLFSLAVAHLFLVPLVALFSRDRAGARQEPMDFLILVPAHNEEEGIAATLQNLLKLESPGQTRIVVIADNCVDKTADVARTVGVCVIERNDRTHRGKGYALKYALDRCDADQFGAVVVVDADTIVDSNMLLAMSDSFHRGAGAVQVSNQLSITESAASPLARLQQMANQVENILFYDARSRLGLGILLRGTGMAIRTDILQSHPWDSYSITEDVDYSIGLLKKGIKVSFTRQAAVHSAATTTYSDSFGQKQRWAAGTFNLISDRAWSLLVVGLKEKSIFLIELAFSLFLLSRPTLIMIGTLFFGLSFLSGENFQTLFLWWAFGLTSMLVLYLVSGVLFVRNKALCLLSLLQLPFFGFWLLAVQAVALWRRRRLGWVRTKRNEE